MPKTMQQQSSDIKIIIQPSKAFYKSMNIYSQYFLRFSRTGSLWKDLDLSNPIT